tara:strand:- start:133 stop:948 length:816 start_codon:yes stop_codon:yes gene_type:complete
MLIFPTYQTILAKAAAASGGSSHVTTDLDTYYDFGDSDCYTSSSSDVTDLSGNGNGATVYNHSYASYSSDQGGHIILTWQTTVSQSQKIEFDVPNPLRTVGSGAFTIEFWFNPARSSNNNGTLWGHYPGAENTRMILRGAGNCKKLRISNHFFPNWTYIDSTCTYDGTGIVDGEYYGWEHLVLSRESQNTDGVKFYRNNSLIGEETSTLTYSDTDYNGNNIACIGNYPSGTLYAAGRCPIKLGIYRLYIGTALSSTDVTTNWNADKSRFGL